MKYHVKDVLKALNNLSGNRCADISNDFILTKSSNIPGKAVTENPGLVWGNLEMEVKKIAVVMTLTESVIELAAATGVNVVVAHHPVADAASSGGVLLKTYLDLYGIAVFELHEAFHGLHPGIPFLHGHEPFFTSVAYGGIPGNIVYVGNVLPEVKTIGDMVNRINRLMNLTADEQLLTSEQLLRGDKNIQETSVAVQSKILVGSENNPIKKVIHIFPHSGFNSSHLEALMTDHPDADTLLASISHVYSGHELIAKAEEIGLNFLCGNSHAMEIYENGLPLAYAIRLHLPKAEVVVFRERVTSTPLDGFGNDLLRSYAKDMANKYLQHRQATQRFHDNITDM